jgi:hypothetical protein
MQQAKVLSVETFPSPIHLRQRLMQLGSRLEGRDQQTGQFVYRTAAGVYLRDVNGQRLEVLSHCTC